MSRKSGAFEQALADKDAVIDDLSRQLSNERQAHEETAKELEDATPEPPKHSAAFYRNQAMAKLGPFGDTRRAVSPPCPCYSGKDPAAGARCYHCPESFDSPAAHHAHRLGHHAPGDG
jgi:hypothetical protein